MMDQDVFFDSLTPAELHSDDSWWEIYDAAFPSAEREPRAVILDSLQTGVGVAVRVRSRDETIAIATLHLLKNPSAIFLVYLATTRNLRGRGLGSALLEYAWQIGVAKLSDADHQAIGLIAEVDSPEESIDDEERHIRQRRIAFFQRQGLTLLPYPYIQPPVDGKTNVPMLLMFRAAPEHLEPDVTLTEQLIQAIYFQKYHRVNGIPEEYLTRLLQAKL